jgi:hypothetical protein
VAAEVILEGRKADELDLERIRSTDAPRSNVIAFPRRPHLLLMQSRHPLKE